MRAVKEQRKGGTGPDRRRVPTSSVVSGQLEVSTTIDPARMGEALCSTVSSSVFHRVQPFCGGHFRVLLFFVLSFGLLSESVNVTYDHRALVIDGARRLLISGSIHYPRSTPEVAQILDLCLQLLLLLSLSLPSVPFLVVTLPSPNCC